MNISAISGAKPAFKQLLVSTDDMGSMAKMMTDELEREISYASEIHELDKRGIDVVIFADSKSPDDRAKIVFVNRENKLFKNGDKDHFRTGKEYSFKHNDMLYYTNSGDILDFAGKILRGEAKTTTKPTNSLREMLKYIPIR